MKKTCATPSRVYVTFTGSRMEWTAENELRTVMTVRSDPLSKPYLHRRAGSITSPTDSPFFRE